MISSNVPTISNYEYVAWKKGISGTLQSGAFPSPTLSISEVTAGTSIYLIYNIVDPGDDDDDDDNIIEVEICAGDRVTFTATPINGGSSPIWQWKKNGEDIIGATNNTYSYYPENNDTISCLLISNANCAAPTSVISDIIAIKIKPLNTITLTSNAGTDAQILCFNSAVTNITYSTVGATGASVSGLPDGVTGNWVNNIVTISGTPTESGIFNYTVTLLGDCPVTKTGMITVNEFSTGSLITANNDTICSGAATTLIASAQGVINPTFRWYANANTANILHTGDSLATGALNSTVIFYVSVEGDNYCEGASNAMGRKAVTVTVNQYANAKSSINISGTTAICENSGTTLTATVTVSSGITNPVFKWYSDDTSAATLLHTGSEYATQALSTTTTFFVSVSGDNFCESLAGARRSITVTTKPRSTGDMITADDVTVCDGIGAILTASATGISGNPTFRWYADSTSTDVLYTGDSYQTDCFTGTNTYYVSVESNDFCEGEANTKGRKAVTVSHKSIATENLITAEGVIICKGSRVTLTATAPEVINPIFRWYNNINQSNPIFMGDSLLTEVINSTTSFYVSVEGDNFCEGTGSTGRKAVEVTISADIEPVIIISADTDTIVCMDTYITFSSEIDGGGANPTYQWKVNGVNVGTEATYSYIPENGDNIVCELTSSKMCANPATVVSNAINMTVNLCAVILDLKLFLQGPIKAGQLNMSNQIQMGSTFMPDLKLPVTNPYGASDTCMQINNSASPVGEVADWILVEIWGNIDMSSPTFQYTYDLVASRALLLQPNGMVVDTNGQAPRFLPYLDSEVRIVVKHRDHVAVISSAAMNFEAGYLSYDFSTGLNKALKFDFSIEESMVMDNTGTIACLWAGDLKTGNFINYIDVTIFNSAIGDWGSYMIPDMNMDGAVNYLDGTYVLYNSGRGLFSPVYFFKKNN
jgi:hypothetical protein